MFVGGIACGGVGEFILAGLSAGRRRVCWSEWVCWSALECKGTRGNAGKRASAESVHKSGHEQPMGAKTDRDYRYDADTEWT